MPINLLNKIFNKFIRFKRRELVCLGDSHVDVYKYIQEHNLLPNFSIEVKNVGGATAMGMVNPNSRTNALKIFTEYLKDKNKNSVILVQLGEVDCGFVIWYRAKKYHLSVKSQLNNYFSFVKDIKPKFKHIVITGAALPTIKDGQDWGEVANLRREVKVPIIKRTKLTLDYNSALKKFAVNNSFIYLDI